MAVFGYFGKYTESHGGNKALGICHNPPRTPMSLGEVVFGQRGTKKDPSTAGVQ